MSEAAMTENAAPATTPSLSLRDVHAKSRLSLWGPPLLLAVLLIIVWYIVSAMLGDKNYLLPPPHVVIEQAILDTRILFEILDATWKTAQVALVGLAIAIAIGVV